MMALTPLLLAVALLPGAAGVRPTDDHEALLLPLEPGSSAPLLESASSVVELARDEQGDPAQDCSAFASAWVNDMLRGFSTGIGGESKELMENPNRWEKFLKGVNAVKQQQRMSTFGFGAIEKFQKTVAAIVGSINAFNQKVPAVKDKDHDEQGERVNAILREYFSMANPRDKRTGKLTKAVTALASQAQPFVTKCYANKRFGKAFRDFYPDEDGLRSGLAGKNPKDFVEGIFKSLQLFDKEKWRLYVMKCVPMQERDITALGQLQDAIDALPTSVEAREFSHR
mmetsp:Transcript_9101/g.20239  ORF Transcript_9101/g.20239 Transcript_9101/m.20239 type:complete len:284 (+) Transcript_9101:56-907(+)